MKRFESFTLPGVLRHGLILAPCSASAHGVEEDLGALIEVSCLDCHDADTESPRDFEVLGHDLPGPAVFRRWEKVYDQVRTGERRPGKKGPDAGMVRITGREGVAEAGFTFNPGKR